MKKGKRRVTLAALMTTLLMAAFATAPLSAMAETADTENATTTFEFVEGNLTFANTPAISFESNVVTGVTQSFAATSVTSALQVSDARGSGAGWNVQATLSGFTDATLAESLAGAVLTLNNGAETATEGTAGTAPVPEDVITIPADGTTVANVATAASGAGIGVWNTSWIAADVLLNVPGAVQTPGIHTATLTWILADVPA